MLDDGAVPILGPYHEPAKRRWRIVVKDGKNRTSVFCHSEAEAVAMLPVLRAELEAATPLLLRDALELYLSHKQLAGLKERSISSISDKLRRFLPLEQTVSSVSEAAARKLYTELMARPGKRGPMAAATHHAVLKSVKEFWRWMIENQHATTSPWVGVKPVGRAEFGKRQARHGEAELLDRTLFEDARNGSEGALALLVQLYGGLRSGEVLALRIADVDRISIGGGARQTQIYVVRGKTKNAKRSIKLYDGVAELLHKFCEGRPATDRIFAADRPQQPATPWLWKRLQTYCRRLGLPPLCPHSLRGLNATLAIEGGATTDAVAASLGHANFAITAKHYADPSAVLNAALGKIPAALQHGQPGQEEDRLATLVSGLSPDDLKRLKSLLADAS